MNTNSDVEILPEDRVQMTNDQKNLITLALEKQLPFEDAEFLESVQKKANKDSYSKIDGYFEKKYGEDFAKIYFATITGGEEGFKEAVNFIEESRALQRIKKQKED